MSTGSSSLSLSKYVGKLYTRYGQDNSNSIIKGVASPDEPYDAANKQYVDNLISDNTYFAGPGIIISPNNVISWDSSQGLGTITSAIWNANTIAVEYGGTSNTSYTPGTLLFYNGTRFDSVSNNIVSASGQLTLQTGTIFDGPLANLIRFGDTALRTTNNALQITGPLSTSGDVSIDGGSLHISVDAQDHLTDTVVSITADGAGSSDIVHFTNFNLTNSSNSSKIRQTFFDNNTIDWAVDSLETTVFGSTLSQYLRHTLSPTTSTFSRAGTTSSTDNQVAVFETSSPNNGATVRIGDSALISYSGGIVSMKRGTSAIAYHINAANSLVLGRTNAFNIDNVTSPIILTDETTVMSYMYMNGNAEVKSFLGFTSPVSSTVIARISNLLTLRRSRPDGTFGDR